MNWRMRLNHDPLPWLLEPNNPAVRYFALVELLDRPLSDPAVLHTKAAINESRPIKQILAAQHPDGYWSKPGSGYSPKYQGTIWQVIFLDQLGADGSDPRVQAACEYVLTHSQSENGGFGISGRADGVPTKSSVAHCLNGNLLRSLLNFGFGADVRVRHAIEWQARAITGDGFHGYYKSGTTGPGFACAANNALPCAWGAIKALRGLARVPADAQSRLVQKAIRVGVQFLLSCDPSKADYPAGYERVSSSWFKLGFPSGYVADVLQNLEVLSELGYGRAKRLHTAIAWLLSKQDAQGRWKNQYAYSGKMWADVEAQGAESKWVTLRACRVLKAAS
jgi:hypothetical protein